MRCITLLKNKAFKISLFLGILLFSFVAIYKLHKPRKEIHVSCGQLIEDFSINSENAVHKYSNVEIYITGFPVYIWYPKCFRLFSTFRSGMYIEEVYSVYDFKMQRNYLVCSFSTYNDKSILGKEVEIKGVLDTHRPVRFRKNTGLFDGMSVYLKNCEIINVQ